MTTLTQPETIIPASSPPPESPPLLSRARAKLIAGGVVVGSLAVMGLTIWHPEPGDDEMFSYDAVAPIRDAWWAWHVFGALAIMVAVVSLSLAISVLVRARGSACANVGAALSSLGAMAFGVGIAAEGVLFASLTDPKVLPVDQGTNAMSYLNDHPDRFLTLILPGIVLMTVGMVVLATGLLRARSVPRWVPITLIVTNVASFAVPFGIVGVVINGVMTVSILAVAWYLWQQTRHS